MAEFEEKLNSILGNEKAMGQIMALARSLSGENGPRGMGHRARKRSRPVSGTERPVRWILGPVLAAGADRPADAPDRGAGAAGVSEYR